MNTRKENTDKFTDIMEGLIDYESTPRPLPKNLTRTENGAIAHRSTGSKLLDFFSVGGALRNRDGNEVAVMFEEAFAEEPLLALKALFYFRDVRGGQGERTTFRTILRNMASRHPEVVAANIHLIANYGRWDDLFVLFGTPLEQTMMDVIAVQLAHDRKSETPSLLGKWLKSENASSPTTKRLAKKIRWGLQMHPRVYRKMLTELRAKIGVLETTISNNEWETIQYGKLPSKAGLIYRKAFRRHDGARYEQFLQDVNDGKETINAGVLYPYELVEKYSKSRWYGATDEDAAVEAMWKNLPNYFENAPDTRGMVVADVSGSMDGRPMDVSVSLAIYCAERMQGPFANKYMTFTSSPKLITINPEDTLAQKVHQVMSTDVGYNTNVEAVFNLILRTAVEGELKQSDLPTHLYMVSDMEFDAAQRGSRVPKTLFQTIEKKFEEAGYRLPTLVFWNVDSRNKQQPMSMDDRGFQLVSGCSPSIFKALLDNKQLNAYDMMLEVLNGDRYQPITVA